LKHLQGHLQRYGHLSVFKMTAVHNQVNYLLDLNLCWYADSWCCSIYVSWST